jgi:hypothetical protein
MSIAKFYPPGLGGPVKVEFRSWVHAKIPCIHVVAPVPWSRPTNRTTKRVSRPRLRSQPAHRTPARSCSVLARPLRSSRHCSSPLPRLASQAPAARPSPPARRRFHRLRLYASPPAAGLKVSGFEELRGPLPRCPANCALLPLSPAADGATGSGTAEHSAPTPARSSSTRFLIFGRERMQEARVR